MDKIAPNRNGYHHTDSNGSTTDIDEDTYAHAAAIINPYHIREFNGILSCDKDGVIYEYANGKWNAIPNDADDSSGTEHAPGAGDTDAVTPKFRLVGAGDTGVDADPDCNGNA